MAVVYIGLGSNVGDRWGYLREAVKRISRRCGDVIASSSIRETKAVDYTDQPDFMNQVIKIGTDLSPDELLIALKEIESEIGRIYRFDKGPREIDLDILLYDNIILNKDDLTIPHRGITKRIFVLEHLIELDPLLADPVTGVRYAEVSIDECS